MNGLTDKFVLADEVTGVILAGGKSTRMGQDKALVLLKGKPFIQHVAETLHAMFDKVIVSGNMAEYDFLGLPVVKDIYENCGPLGGIHAALGSVKTPYVFIAPCDTPFLNSIIIETLLGNAGPDRIAIASTGERLQPLVGVYPVSCRSRLDEFLASGQRKVKDFLVTTPYCPVRLDAWVEKLQNINEVSQLQALRRY